jgi:hypothetical protein
MIRIPEYLERRRGPEGSNGANHATLGLGAEPLEPVGL